MGLTWTDNRCFIVEYMAGNRQIYNQIQLADGLWSGENKGILEHLERKARILSNNLLWHEINHHQIVIKPSGNSC